VRKWFWIGYLSLAFVGWGMVAFAEEDGGEDKPVRCWRSPRRQLSMEGGRLRLGMRHGRHDLLQGDHSEGCVCELKPEDECCDNCGGAMAAYARWAAETAAVRGRWAGSARSTERLRGLGGKAEFSFSLGKKIGSNSKAGFLYVKVPGPVSNAASPRWLSFAGDAQAGVRRSFSEMRSAGFMHPRRGSPW
jgi:hypothetical protein